MMKLTIEEKAKAYDDALERAEKALEVFGTDKCEGARQIFSLFPELKESKDERIRRNIIAALKGEGYYDCDLTNECIAWVEKQGGQKPADKVEPKFHIGDTVRHKNVEDSECTIEFIDDLTYFGDTTNFDIKYQNNWELVEQKSNW